MDFGGFSGHRFFAAAKSIDARDSVCVRRPDCFASQMRPDNLRVSELLDRVDTLFVDWAKLSSLEATAAVRRVTLSRELTSVGEERPCEGA